MFIRPRVRAPRAFEPVVTTVEAGSVFAPPAPAGVGACKTTGRSSCGSRPRWAVAAPPAVAGRAVPDLGAPIADFPSYARAFARNEKELLARPRAVFDRLAREFCLADARHARLLALRRAFRAWRAGGDDADDATDRLALAAWRAEHRRVLRLALAAYLHQRRVCARGFERLAAGASLYRGRVTRRARAFAEWRSRVELKDARKRRRPPLPGHADPMAATAVIVREGTRKSTGEKVKVKVRVAPLGLLHDSHYAHARIAPIDEKVRAYALIGYPTWFLERMVRARDRRLAQRPAIEAMIERVFGKYMKSKPAKPKPKTLQQKVKQFKS